MCVVVAVADSILECLEIQGLTEFIEYLTASVYFDLFNSTTDSHLTLFAPTNEALNRLQRSGFIPPPSTTFFNVSQLVANHIVEGNVTVASLKQFGNKIYVSIDGRNLHRVSIAIIDQSSVTYPQNQYYYNPVIQNQHEIIVSSFKQLHPFTFTLPPKVSARIIISILCLWYIQLSFDAYHRKSQPANQFLRKLSQNLNRQGEREWTLVAIYHEGGPYL